MKLNFENVLSVYNILNAKAIVCRINVEASKMGNNCRCLNNEQWKIFDNGLQSLFTDFGDHWDDKEQQEFHLYEDIKVIVKKWNVSLKALSEIFAENLLNAGNIKLALDCCITRNPKRAIDDARKNPLEYEPEYVCMNSDDKYGKTIPCVPYTPSPKKRVNIVDKTIDNELLDHDLSDEIYLPKPLRKSSDDNATQEMHSPPEYKPAPIKSEDNQLSTKCFENEDLKTNVMYNELCSKSKEESLKSLEYTPTSQNESNTKLKPVPKYVPTPIPTQYATKRKGMKEKRDLTSNKKKMSQNKESSELANEANLYKENIPVINSAKENKNTLTTMPKQQEYEDDTEDNVITAIKSNEANSNKSTTMIDNAFLRRSKRSPIKPKRLIEEKIEENRKLKTPKISARNKELFGSDDDDDDADQSNSLNEDRNVYNNENSCSPGSSLQKKRKLHQSTDCEREKRDIRNWLSKNRPMPSTSKSVFSKHSKLSKKTRTEEIKEDRIEIGATPTKEEIKERLEQHRLEKENQLKIKKLLQEMKPISPKKVEYLSLQELSVNELLDTFDQHKPKLDKIYEIYRRKSYVKNHQGIDHCFVMDLIDPKLQTKMLEKVSKVYKSKHSTAHVTLFANAILPEWILNIFMNKYSLDREQAIEQVRAQDAYKLHLQDESETSFL
uniref:Uncharacterized protein n=1 Tax=Glossina austeni TaxID=7395 RepID=A0A1A9VQN6_GLOAU